MTTPATALTTRTTAPPTSVTSDLNPHTSSARMPRTVCAAALRGRHTVLFRRPNPRSIPSEHAAATAPRVRPVASRPGSRLEASTSDSVEIGGNDWGTRKRIELRSMEEGTQRNCPRRLAGAFERAVDTLDLSGHHRRPVKECNPALY